MRFELACGNDSVGRIFWVGEREVHGPEEDVDLCSSGGGRKRMHYLWLSLGSPVQLNTNLFITRRIHCLLFRPTRYLGGRPLLRSILSDQVAVYHFKRSG